MVRKPQITNGRSVVSMFVAFTNLLSSSHNHDIHHQFNSFGGSDSIVFMVASLTLNSFLGGVANTTVIVIVGVDIGS